VRDWVSHAAGQKYGALYASLPTKAGTKGCGRTLCALLTALDVANGMKLLHKYKILHSDLKPHNVLLVSSHTVRALIESDRMQAILVLI
jgi:serine/threonine protein kinase